MMAQVLPLLPLALAFGAAPAVELSPAHARPGDAFLVTVHGLPPGERLAGDVEGSPLSFYACAEGYRAVGALPIEAVPGPLALEIRRPDGPAITASLLVTPGGFPERRLRLPERFVRPPPPEVQQRIREDQEAFDRAYDQPASPPLFAKPFERPRDGRVTGGYGDRRTLNGRKSSRHYGIDIASPLGAPVVAANRGRVVLVRDCWASGLSVVLWHGAGLFSTYFHLSRALVAVGEEVARGQRIGLVGRSGRATGPHLHWGMKVEDRLVDPESVLRLPFDAPSARAP